MTNMGKIVKNGIEVGASSKDVFLTQAEYDALPESKNSDGIHYIITDADADVKYAAEVMMSDGTSVEDEFDLVPKREVVTDDVEIDTPDVDADTLGGRITAEDVEEIASDISTLTSNLDSNEFTSGIYGDTIIETKNDYRIIFRTKSVDDKITKSSMEVTNRDSSEVVWSLPIIKQKNFSGTTSASGAVLHNCVNAIIIGAQTNDGKVCTVRGDGYLSVYIPTANGLETVKNTEVSGIVYYIEK